jgi:hypothetical protein
MLGNAATDFHVVGYAFAFSGSLSQLNATNQNARLQPESINLPTGSIIVPVAERVIVADAILSDNANTPGINNPGNNYVNVQGGFYINSVSAHLKGLIPRGGNVGYKDGHAEWRKFNVMVPRTTGGKVFWW